MPHDPYADPNADQDALDAEEHRRHIERRDWFDRQQPPRSASDVQRLVERWRQENGQETKLPHQPPQIERKRE